MASLLSAFPKLVLSDSANVLLPLISIGGKTATKLFVTLNIRNVTLEDDSSGALGRYECHAFAVNDSAARKHGFTVKVIKGGSFI